MTCSYIGELLIGRKFERENKPFIVFIKFFEGFCFRILDLIPFILNVRLVNAPAGVTQEEGHTGFLHLLSAVLALIFITGRIQPSLSLVDRAVDFVYPRSNRSPLVEHD